MQLRSSPLLLSTLAVCGLLTACAAPDAGKVDLIRYKIPDSTFPIASAVEVPPGASIVYLSGKVPPVVDESRHTSDPAAYGGDTEGQTVATLKAIEAQLLTMGLGMSDVVKMQVFLVEDPAKGGKMDFAGFMRGYTQFFGTASQPNLPARSAFEITALANPAWFVEIEVIAVRGAKFVRK